MEEYTTTLTYHTQILGIVRSCMNITIWKVCGPLKVKFFVWLAIQSRFWMVDHLEGMAKLWAMPIM